MIFVNDREEENEKKEEEMKSSLLNMGWVEEQEDKDEQVDLKIDWLLEKEESHNILFENQDDDHTEEEEKIVLQS